MSAPNPASSSEPEYILRTGEEEFVRLGFQHRAWAAKAFELWQRAGLGPGHSVIDVGCGPGFATIDMAHLVGPSGRVVAVDESPRFIERLKRRMEVEPLSGVIEPVLSDAQTVDLSPQSADFAYARWVLCFVARPEDVVARIGAALKPGGVFAIQDYNQYEAMQLSPRSEVFVKTIGATAASWRRRGGDPDVASRLPSLLADHGFEIREVTSLVRTARPGSLLWNWPQTFFRNFLPVLVDEGLLTQDDVAAWHEDWEARANDPAAALTTPPMLDIVAVKR